MRENTLQAEDRGFESEAVYTYYKMVPNMYRMPWCVTPIPTVAEQADSKPMSHVFELHLPGRKIAGDLSKAWRKKINTVRRFASPRL